MQYITAEEFGVLERIRVFSSTRTLPVDLGAYSSRGTLMIGNATVDACRKLKQQIQNQWQKKWEVKPKVALADGKAFYTKDTSQHMSIVEAFHLAEAKFGSLAATGAQWTEKLGGDTEWTIGASPADFTAHVAM